MRHRIIVVIAVACATALLALAPRPAPPGGPVLAIWDDGLVIFSFDPCASENLQFGSIPRASVDEISPT